MKIKRILILMITLSFFMTIAVTASAHHHDNGDNGGDQPAHHHYSHDYDNDWRHHDQQGDYDSDQWLPFRWHDQRESIREHHHLQPVYGHGWQDRFPDEHAYNWHSDKGFWHNGQYVTDAVLFFDDDGTLVSIGYRANGVFIHFRENHDDGESHDAFFFSLESR